MFSKSLQLFLTNTVFEKHFQENNKIADSSVSAVLYVLGLRNVLEFTFAMSI